LEHTPSLATIIPRSDILGSASQMDGDDCSETGMEYLVISSYAGAAAEIRLTGDHETAVQGACSDYDKADDYLPSLVSAREDLETRASELVAEHWSLVQRVAEELKDYGTLEWGELDFIYAIYRGEETEDDLAEYRQRAAAAGEFSNLRGRRKL